MAKLTNAQKLFIVGRLACFDSPSEVVEAVKQELGLTLTRQQVAFYDPTTAEGARLSDDLKAVFQAARTRFIEHTEDIPAAHKAYRLRQLQRLIEQSGRNPRLKADLLKQAAQESGGAFTNRHEVSGPGGGPIQTAHKPDLSQLSDQELMLLEQLVSKSTPEPG